MRHPQKVIDRAAYQIWGLIQRTGGDCTVFDMAEVTELSAKTCVTICRTRGWNNDYRKTTAFDGFNGTFLNGKLSDLERWA